MDCGRVGRLNSGGPGGLTEEVTSEQRPEGNERASSVSAAAREFQAKRTAVQRPQGRSRLGCLRSSKKVSVARAERGRGRRRNQGGGSEPDGMEPGRPWSRHQWVGIWRQGQEDVFWR